jgi:hypothetical protein
VLQNNSLLISENEPDKKKINFQAVKQVESKQDYLILLLVQSKVDGGSKYTLKAFLN